MPSAVIRRVVDEARERSGLGARKFEASVGLSPYFLRGLLDQKRPQVPSVDRADEICRALGITMTIGTAQSGSRSVNDASDSQISGQRGVRLDPRLAQRLRSIAMAWELMPKNRRHQFDVALKALTDGVIIPVLNSGRGGSLRIEWLDERALFGDAGRPSHDYDYVQRYSDEVRLAAGTGVDVENESTAGYVAFRRDWMRSHQLRAETCSLVDVTGDSMEETLFDGDSALVDHASCEPADEKIFALQTREGPLVKRLRFDESRWWAYSDNPDYKRRPLDGDDRIIGRVAWWARTLVEGESQPASR